MTAYDTLVAKRERPGARGAVSGEKRCGLSPARRKRNPERREAGRQGTLRSEKALQGYLLPATSYLRSLPCHPVEPAILGALPSLELRARSIQLAWQTGLLITALRCRNSPANNRSGCGPIHTPYIGLEEHVGNLSAMARELHEPDASGFVPRVLSKF